MSQQIAKPTSKTPLTKDESLKTQPKSNIKELLPLLGVLSLIFGIIKLLVYYSFFNFNVFEFIELDEIVTHIIKDAVVILVPILLYTFIYIMYVPKLEPAVNLKTIKAPRMSRADKLNLAFAILLVAAILFLLIGLFSNDRISLATLLMYLGGFVYLLLMISVYKFYERFNRLFNVKTDKTIITYSSVILFTLFCASSLFSVNLVKNHAGSVISEVFSGSKDIKDQTLLNNYIILNAEAGKKDTVKSTTNYYYIGKTNKFVFFYSPLNNNVDVYAEKDIKKYSLN
jgi:hypothetical protein